MNLAPLRETLLADARAEHDHVLAAAAERARALVENAKRDAAALARTARAEGVAAADVAAGEQLADAHHRARAVRLGAQRLLYEELQTAVLAEAEALRGTPAHEELVRRLGTLARSQLGPDASVRLDAAGGVRASQDGRTVDYTLPTLVRRALEGGGGRTWELWR